MSRASRTWSTYIKTRCGRAKKLNLRESLANSSVMRSHVWEEKKKQICEVSHAFLSWAKNCLQNCYCCYLSPEFFAVLVHTLPLVGTLCAFAKKHTFYLHGKVRQGWQISTPTSRAFLPLSYNANEFSSEIFIRSWNVDSQKCCSSVWLAKIMVKSDEINFQSVQISS